MIIICFIDFLLGSLTKRFKVLGILIIAYCISPLSNTILTIKKERFSLNFGNFFLESKIITSIDGLMYSKK